MSDAELTMQDLLAVASADGYAASEEQLQRAQRAGVLPRSRQRRLGRPHGSETWYPAGAERQLLAYCRVHHGRQDFPIARFWLWWEGFPVDTRMLRRSFHRFLRPTAAMRRHLEEAENPSDAAEAVARKLAAGESVGGKFPPARARRLLRDEEELRAVLEILVLLYFGEPVHPDIWTYSPAHGRPLQQGLFKLLGFDRAGSDWRDLSGGAPPDPSALPKLTSALEAGGFLQGPGSVTALLDSAPAEELEWARDCMRAILEVLGLAIAALLAQHGAESTGLGLLANVQPTDIRTRLTLIAGGIALRRAGLGDRLDAYLEGVREAEPLVRIFHAFARAHGQYRQFAPAILRGEVDKLPSEVVAALRQVVNSMPNDVQTRLSIAQATKGRDQG